MPLVHSSQDIPAAVGVSGGPGAESRSSGTPDELLGKFFEEFLDEAAFGEFRRIERLFADIQLQGNTISGYPVTRPSDCAIITRSLELIFQDSKQRFRTCDEQVTTRFENLIDGFHKYCARTYPSEATAALILHARVLLFMNQPKRVIEIISQLALRPYAVENNLGQCADLVELLAQAHLRQGTISDLPISFIAFGAWLASCPRGPSTYSIAKRMSPYVNCDRPDDGAPIRSFLIRKLSTYFLKASRSHAGILGKLRAAVSAHFCRLLLALCYKLLTRSARLSSPFSLRMNMQGPVLVTRAMGGIGDLLMMEPGLEALAARKKQQVHLAIPRKFFPIFANNPHVHLVDINGPIIDVSAYSEFINLSLCPAGAYESRTRPNVKQGRVEIFARAMGVRRGQLSRQGWHINQFPGATELTFCEDFIEEHQLGNRPLVGVQPYSRDSYKDHPGITEIIGDLAREYDVIIFHHLTDGLPKAKGIANTAGLPLASSLALISRVSAMVTVDSAFLHAAAAHDVPVVALFGPTDARTFTRHHRDVTILWKPEHYGCMPCWRNEDLACKITGQRSVSPCLAAIGSAEVLNAVANAISSSKQC